MAPYLRHGDTYMTGDGNGAAVAAARRRAAERGGGRGVRRGCEELVGNVARFEQLAETFERHHPDEPLYYCQSLATVPAYQGRGIGSAFLRAMLTRADQEGFPAYHEATTPRNRALYERHGYLTQGEFVLPDGGPPLWRMWRSPR